MGAVVHFGRLHRWLAVQLLVAVLRDLLVGSTLLLHVVGGHRWALLQVTTILGATRFVGDILAERVLDPRVYVTLICVSGGGSSE